MFQDGGCGSRDVCSGGVARGHGRRNALLSANVERRELVVISQVKTALMNDGMRPCIALGVGIGELEVSFAHKLCSDWFEQMHPAVFAQHVEAVVGVDHGTFD